MRRPAGVTLVAVLAWIGGALQLVLGLLALYGVLHPDGIPAAALWVTVVIGAITVLVSFGLFGGSNVARVLVTISLAISLANALLQAALHPTPDIVAASAISGILALIGILLLYTRRANSFFG